MAPVSIFSSSNVVPPSKIVGDQLLQGVSAFLLLGRVHEDPFLP